MQKEILQLLHFSQRSKRYVNSSKFDCCAKILVGFFCFQLLFLFFLLWSCFFCFVFSFFFFCHILVWWSDWHWQRRWEHIWTVVRRSGLWHFRVSRTALSSCRPTFLKTKFWKSTNSTGKACWQWPIVVHRYVCARTPQTQRSRHSSVSQNTNTSQFFITAGDDMAHMNEKYTIFGEVAEGYEVNKRRSGKKDEWAANKRRGDFHCFF